MDQPASTAGTNSAPRGPLAAPRQGRSRFLTVVGGGGHSAELQRMARDVMMIAIILALGAFVGALALGLIIGHVLR